MFRLASSRITSRATQVMSRLPGQALRQSAVRQSTTDATAIPLNGTNAARGSLLSRAWAGYKEALATRPLLTNACTTAVLASAADACAQKIEAGSIDAPVSLKRCFTTASFNVAISPMLRGWFLLLEKMFPAKATWSVISGKIIVNQSVISPICNSLFFGWVIFAREGFTPAAMNEYKKKLTDDLVPTQQAAWAMWVPANLINFGFVPLQHRVLYLNVVATFWTCFLSMQAYRKRCSVLTTDDAATVSTSSSVTIEQVDDEVLPSRLQAPSLALA